MTLPSTRSVPQSRRISDNAGRTRLPMKIRSRQPSERNSFVARPSWPTEIQWWRKRATRSESQAPRSANRIGAMPRAASESATANGIAPPPAITPTGEEISGAAEIIAAAPPSSTPVAVVGGQTERAVLAIANERKDLGNRRIFGRQRLHRAQALGEDAAAVKQFLVERAHGGEPLPGELAALHAGDVQPLQARILAVGEAERDDVAAHAADAADHHLRANARELMHRRQA